MIKKFASLIRRILGRVFKMVESFIGFGAMLIPLSFVILIWRDKADAYVYITLIAGFICLIWGFIYAFRKERSEQKKESVKQQIELEKFTIQMTELNNVAKSIKELATEIRKDRDGNKRNDS